MNKQKVTEQILNIISTAEDSFQYSKKFYFEQNGELVKNNINIVSKAFSGSWIGYHAYVYYKDFNQSNAGDHFSPEWGFMNVSSNPTSIHWIEKTYDEVKDALMKGVDKDYERNLVQISQDAIMAFDNVHSSITTLLFILIEANRTSILDEIKKDVSNIRGFISSQEFVRYMSPKGQTRSRDSTAMSQGYKTPPHIALEAWHMSQNSPFEGLLKIIQAANRLLKYMEMQDLIEHKIIASGSKVFIGHGHSALWREFKDFISDRLHLGWDEFNRDPTAGLATKERLQTMLNQACFAFLVMTAEDQHANETLHARENVIHEVGLFQAKLGFRRAIVLLEDGCSEFSNIIGLSQIRFPTGNISSAFEEVRKVLEREGILKE